MLYVSQLWNAYFVVVFAYCSIVLGFPVSSAGKEFACNVGDWVRSRGWQDPLEEGMATQFQYSSLENLHELRSLVGYSPKGHRVAHD